VNPHDLIRSGDLLCQVLRLRSDLEATRSTLSDCRKAESEAYAARQRAEALAG